MIFNCVFTLQTRGGVFEEMKYIELMIVNDHQMVSTFVLVVVYLEINNNRHLSHEADSTCDLLAQQGICLLTPC